MLKWQPQEVFEEIFESEGGKAIRKES